MARGCQRINPSQRHPNRGAVGGAPRLRGHPARSSLSSKGLSEDGELIYCASVPASCV
jgi:hypothetical protein